MHELVCHDCLSLKWLRMIVDDLESPQMIPASHTGDQAQTEPMLSATDELCMASTCQCTMITARMYNDQNQWTPPVDTARCITTDGHNPHVNDRNPGHRQWTQA
jgi:hypothetical protein